MADSLFDARNYLAAGVEYERLIFDRNGELSINEFLLRKSYCYKAQNKFEKALETLQRSDLYSGDDNIRVQLFYESILNAHLCGKYDISLSLINEWKYNFSNGSDYNLEITEILTLSELMKWQEARTKFVTFSTKYNLHLDSTIFNPVLNHKFRKPEKAITLSYLLPGSGIIYAGAPLRGITSAALQAGAIALVVQGLTEGYFFSSALTGTALFYALYNGGAQYAANLTVTRNNKRINDFKVDLLKSLKEAEPK